MIIDIMILREDINGKKTFSFGHCPNDGGGGLPIPKFFGPLFSSAFLVNKHRKNCECCPGHYLIVNHYSSI